MSSLLGLSKQANASSREAWDRFAPHRKRVMALFPEGPLGTLALLGAGNCNDVELGALCERASLVHLVDLDDEATRRAIDRLPEALRGRVREHVLDLTGLGRELESFREAPPKVEVFDGLADRVFAALSAALGPADVVLSSCVLSQIAWTFQSVLGPGHPALDLATNVAVGSHLASAARLLAPGGALLVAVDTLTDERYPLAALIERSDAATVLRELTQAGACQTGTHPTFVERTLSAAPGIGSVRRRGAWLWQVSEARAHLVYGMVARRR